MTVSTRRRFLAEATSAAAASTLLAGPSLGAAGANEKIVVGLIGHGNQGGNHLKVLQTQPNVEVAYVCDPDAERRQNALKVDPDVKLVDDLRRILDDPGVDGVIIATPDHWHAPAALLALAAGKHVYVEKPCAHNIREAGLLRDAARRGKLKVQHGTQARSSRAFQQVMQKLRDGIIGEVLSAKAWNIQRRVDLGHCQPSPPPAVLDFDMWTGPAVKLPYQTNRSHYNWHWWFDYGAGGIGNDGIHHLDYARWGLGVQGLPTRVSAMAGKYFFDDDRQFPDTQQVAFEYADDGAPGGKKLLVYEQRLWSVTYPFNVDAGAEYYGTEGEMFLSSRGKIRILHKKNQRVDWKPDGSLKYEVADNEANWFDCIRNGGTPNANMEVAYRTASAVHLGNIASRVGRELVYDGAAQKIVDDAEANSLITRKYRAGGYWAIPKGV